MLLKIVIKSTIKGWTLNFPTDPNHSKSQILFHKKEPIGGLYKRNFGLCTFAVVVCNYFKCWLRFATQWSEIKKFTQKLKTIFFHVIYMLSKIKYNLFSEIGKHY